MNEIRSAPSMKTVGEILKSAREKKGLTQEDVYKFIKIHPRFLNALEQNEYSVFSSSVHIKGFLKNYSSLLDLNVDEVLAIFRREFDEKKVKARILKPIEYPKLLITPAFVTVGTTVILIALFFGYLFYQYRSYTGTPSLNVEKPGSEITISENSIEVIGKTDRDSNVFLNGQEVTVNPDGTFVARVDLSDGLNSLNFMAVNPLGKESRITRTVLVRKDLAEVMGDSFKGKRLEVFANGGSSLVSVFEDGELAFEGSLLSGTSRVFEASQSVKLKANNAGVISVKFNGEDLGAFGKPSESKEKEFN